MKYITVLDFVDGRVYQYNISVDMKTSYEKHKHWSPQCEVCEEYITNKGHSLNNCEWMVHENPQVITN